jgi:hypothetical protein
MSESARHERGWGQVGHASQAAPWRTRKAWATYGLIAVLVDVLYINHVLGDSCGTAADTILWMVGGAASISYLSGFVAGHVSPSR